jgi:hypothetical protein
MRGIIIVPTALVLAGLAATASVPGDDAVSELSSYLAAYVANGPSRMHFVAVNGRNPDGTVEDDWK